MLSHPDDLTALAETLGVPMLEVELVSETLNELDFLQQKTFGDLVGAAIVRNFKEARLKGKEVSIRGLARVIGVQPSTLRRRVEQLIEKGWLERMPDGSVRYSDQGFRYGAPASRRALTRFAQTVKRAGWVDFRPPSG